MVDYGPLDRACKLYQLTASVGEGGVPVQTATLLRDFYATKLPPTRRTPDAEQTSVAGRVASQGIPVYRTRYIPEMATGLRVVTEGRTFLIVRADELGRREGFDVYVEDVR